ncbi:MAG TPA: DeoR family transcriptional regulator [Candidatus Paceibacterota bacterium]|nr:DeoR family transcriptional regulator [Candidatus Paceibacterota bacterium]
MEPQKDKQNDQPKELSLNVEKLAFFNNNAYFVFLYKKCKSLSAALYMVSEHFPDQEPLKWNVREKATHILEDSLALPIAHSGDRKGIVDNLFQSSLEILSFLDLANLSGLISETNRKILRKEFENLISLVEGREESLKVPSNFVLDEEMFKTEQLPAAWNLDSNLKSEAELKDKAQHMKSTKAKGQFRSTPIKDKSSLTKPSIDKTIDRQAVILGMLRKQNNLSIKDISQSFANCSEKTIQRELSQMVEKGLLKKVGERRWSKYSLI